MKYLKILLLLSLAQFYSCSKSENQSEDLDDPAGVEIADSGEEGGDESLDGEALEDEGGGEEVQIADAAEADGEGTDDLGEVSADEAVAGTSTPGEDVALEEVGAPTDAAAADAGSDYVADASTATEAPAGSATEEMGATAASTDTSGIGDATYNVQRNETLMLIAFKLYGDYGRWKEIASLNQDKLNGSTLISPGMTLRYNTQGANFNWSPNGKEHIVKSGDTLSLISNHYYATIHKWKMIWENNKPLIKDPNKIFVGFTIYVPEEGMRDMASDPAPAAPSSPSAPATEPMAQGAAPEALETEFSEDI
jgi:nucleoid-associated protein YgaU